MVRLAEPKEPVANTIVLITEKNLEVEESDAEVVRLLDRLSIRVILRLCRNITVDEIEKLVETASYIIRDRWFLRAGTRLQSDSAGQMRSTFR